MWCRIGVRGQRLVSRGGHIKLEHVILYHLHRSCYSESGVLDQSLRVFDSNHKDSSVSRYKVSRYKGTRSRCDGLYYLNMHRFAWFLYADVDVLLSRDVP